MRSVLVFAIYVLKNRNLSATPPKCLHDPFRGHDPQVGNRWVTVVNGACFLTGGVLDCDLAHRRSVAVLCMLYKTRCYPMHSLCDALLVPYVPVLVTRGALVAHRYTYAPPRCRT